MRRIFAWIMVLCLALSGLAAGEPTETEKGLPDVGQVVSGFEVKEIRDFPLINAQVVLFEHQKTGAGLTYIANEDTNRAFQLTFLTRPTDDTGLPHVFEHATLSGSEKYPSASLWMNLAYQTYNTYMNAYTTDAMTSYPVASLSEAQLLRYADYYTDSCLHPMVLEDESIYRTEAWRYRMASEEDDLTLEGTVYSEMQGALSLTRSANLYANRVTFPGASISHEYGGDPEYIPDMTYEALRGYHSLFYHPSNVMVYLYGQFEDYTAFLQMLDDAFAAYDRTEFHFSEDSYAPLTEPAVTEVPYPTAAGSDDQNQSVIYYYILCPGLRESAAQEQVMDNLATLLGQDASPLMQKLQRALPSGSFGVGREVAAPVDAMVFTASSVNREDAETFRALVDESLREIAESGFAQDMVDSVTASIRLSTRLAPENGDPVNGVIANLAYSYAVSGNPFAYLEQVDSLDSLNDWNQDGRFQEMIRQYLLDPDVYTVTTTYPQPGLKEERDAALAARLAEIKAGMTAEEKQAIIDQTNAEPAEDDASALVARLQAVTVESLPEEGKTYPLQDETDESGVRHIEVTAGVEGIGQPSVYLDAAALPQEDIHWMRLYTRLLGKLDTAEHTREELDVLTARYLYGQTIGVDVTGNGQDWHPYLIAQWTALNEDLSDGYALMKELLFSTRFNQADRLLEEIQAQKASVRASLNQSPYLMELYRSMGESDPAFAYYDYLNFAQYYAFLEAAEQLALENPAEVQARLERVQTFFQNRTGAIAAFAGDETGIEVNRSLAAAFLQELSGEEREPAAYAFEAPAKAEAVIADTNVQFNNVIASFNALGLEEDAGLDVISSLVADQLLIPVLRDQYGVYTPLAGRIANHGLYLITYRDPNVTQTFDYYQQLPELIAQMEISQDVLDGYILNTYSSLAQPDGELTGAAAAVSRAISGIPQDEKMTRMRQVKAVTTDRVREAAEVYQAMWDQGILSTVGSAAAIQQNADLYEQILNPFGAKDNTQVALNDVAEGDAYYEAVRYVFEAGYMQPVDEEIFGVTEPETAGEWALILFQMIGYSGTEQEAMDVLSSFGLLPAGLSAENSISRADLASSVETLCALSGIEGFDASLPESDSETAVRGDAAVLLWRLDTLE